MDIKPFSHKGEYKQRDQVLIFSYEAEEASTASNATLSPSCETTVANHPGTTSRDEPQLMQLITQEGGLLMLESLTTDINSPCPDINL